MLTKIKLTPERIFCDFIESDEIYPASWETDYAKTYLSHRSKFSETFSMRGEDYICARGLYFWDLLEGKRNVS